MKALSLIQPWASAIILGIKKIETRSWATEHRGIIAIHASKGFPKWAKTFAIEEHIAGLLLVPQMLPFAAIIGVATIVDVRPTEELRDAISETERRYGDYSAGRFGWILEDVRALPVPIPASGSLGLWNVPTAVEKRINEILVIRPDVGSAEGASL